MLDWQPPPQTPGAIDEERTFLWRVITRFGRIFLAQSECLFLILTFSRRCEAIGRTAHHGADVSAIIEPLDIVRVNRSMSAGIETERRETLASGAVHKIKKERSHASHSDRQPHRYAGHSH